MKKRLFIVFVVCILAVTLTGCDDVQWFKKDKRVSSVSASELVKDNYYVKQNTRFWPICTTKTGVNMSTTERISKRRVIPLVPSVERTVPDCFYEEGLAISSDDDMSQKVRLERFKSIGMSIGAYNGTFDSSGYFILTKNRENIVEGSSFESALSKTTSNTIRIVSINNENITPAQVDEECGVINVLEPNKEYTVQFYAGTEYYDVKVISDTLMLKSFEMFEYTGDEGMDFSTNSYLYFSMPTDLKTGYYQINGSGLYKYYDCERGKEDVEADTTVPYYASERDQIISFSRQFTLNIPNKTRDLSIRIPFIYETADMLPDIAGFVFSPNGDEYEMKIESDKSEDLLTLSISEAMPGEWTINVTPKDLTISDVRIESSKIDEEASESVEEFNLDTATENVTFYVDTKGEGEVYGYLISPEGRTYDMSYDYDKDKNTGRLEYNLAYAKEGNWTVKVYYHPITTSISEINMSVYSELETDVIVVE